MQNNESVVDTRVHPNKAVAAPINEDELLLYIIKENNKPHNVLKALEECSEFQEVLIKLQTKEVMKRPAYTDLIGEYADVVFRGLIGVCSITGYSPDDLMDSVDEHISMKLKKISGYKEEGKYKNTL